MRGLVAVLSVLGVVSCKTSDPSKVSSAYWRHKERVNLLYSLDSTYIVKSCEPTPELEEGVTTEKNLEKKLENAKKFCKGISKVVTPDALKKAIAEAINPDNKQGELMEAKQQRRANIKVEIQRLKTGVESLEQVVKDMPPDEDFVKDMTVQIETMNTTVKALAAEEANLEQFAQSPGVLRTMDINQTLKLASKVSEVTTEQARLFADMVYAVPLYELVPERDFILVSALDTFAPTCAHNTRMGEKKAIIEGAEKRVVECKFDGTISLLKVECIGQGFTLQQKENSPASCVKAP